MWCVADNHNDTCHTCAEAAFDLTEHFQYFYSLHCIQNKIKKQNIFFTFSCNYHFIWVRDCFSPYSQVLTRLHIRFSYSVGTCRSRVLSCGYVDLYFFPYLEPNLGCVLKIIIFPWHIIILCGLRGHPEVPQWVPVGHMSCF